MSIFNSLGSNYDFKFVIKAFLGGGRKEKLISFLENKYKGKVTLVHKCRDAIELALRNLSKGSLVGINGFTCFVLYEAVKKAGMKVEYLDVEKGELNFSANSLEKKPNLKAVIVQNTLGYPADMEKISRICKERKIILIEDLAHSIGTRYENGVDAGMVGDFITLSFSQDKIIDAVSGGALIER